MRIFIGTFLYVLVSGLLLQFLILPNTPWYAGDGLLIGGDWNSFHRLAIDLSQKIVSNGWGEWEISVAGQAPASVAAAFYAITDIRHPSILLPLHGVLYGISVVALYSIMSKLNGNRMAPITVLLPFYVFPSTAMIWGQIHKDIYSIMGIFLVLRLWVIVWELYVNKTKYSHILYAFDIAAMLLGLLVIHFVRPYLAEVVILASLAVVFVVAVLVFAQRLRVVDNLAKASAQKVKFIFILGLSFGLLAILVPDLSGKINKFTPWELIYYKGNYSSKISQDETTDLTSHRLPIALAAMRAGYDVHIATGITDKHAEMKAHGLKVHPLPLVRGGVGVVNAAHTAWCLLRVVKAVRPDVMHLVTIKPVLLGGLVARVLRVPALVSAVSGLGYVFMAQGLAAKLRLHVVRRVYAWALGHANQLVIFQNPDDMIALQVATGLQSRKAVLIRGSGVNLQQYTVQPVASGKPVVLFPARLLADKGACEFVAAAQQLRAEGVQARFVLVGLMDSANPTSLTQAQVDAWVSDGVVELWGHRADMPAVLASATVVVLPSYREGLPKVLLEAAACGRPVVTTDVPGCRDAIEPGQTGMLVPVGNSAKLAKAIAALLQNPKQCNAMGQAGRALAEREFDVQAVVNKHLAIYEQLLA